MEFKSFAKTTNNGCLNVKNVDKKDNIMKIIIITILSYSYVYPFRYESFFFGN